MPKILATLALGLAFLTCGPDQAAENAREAELKALKVGDSDALLIARCYADDYPQVEVQEETDSLITYTSGPFYWTVRNHRIIKRGQLP